MGTKVDVIYCTTANRNLDKIAIDTGFKLGARLPRSLMYFPIYFADRDWNNPNLGLYVQSINKYKPKVCTVIDIDEYGKLEVALKWAEALPEFIEKVILIPKVSGVINNIPFNIGNKKVILGYSVPTKYGSTTVSTSEFKDRYVHLLGGAPYTQIELAKELNVVSIDCNYHSMKANKYCEFWSGNLKGRKRIPIKNSSFATDIKPNLEAFRISCVNIINSWSEGL